MSEKTDQIIAELAAKLGTTAEHLWGVLIAQAPLSSTISLIILAITAFVFLISVLNLFALSYVKDFEDHHAFSIFINMIVAVFGGIGLVIQLSFFDQMIAGLINPEYWALRELGRIL